MHGNAVGTFVFRTNRWKGIWIFWGQLLFEIYTHFNVLVVIVW